jgi:hypothetical protein
MPTMILNDETRCDEVNLLFSALDELPMQRQPKEPDAANDEGDAEEVNEFQAIFPYSGFQTQYFLFNSSEQLHQLFFLKWFRNEVNYVRVTFGFIHVTLIYGGRKNIDIKLLHYSDVHLFQFH